MNLLSTMKKIKKAPLISVVIPFYNSLSFLLRAISCLKKQSLSSFEVILVDDGSDEDPTPFIAKEIDIDGRFHLIRQPHKNAGAARNLGIKLVRGEYVIFLDADDTFDKRLLEKMSLSAQKYNSDIVLCEASWKNDKTRHILHVNHLSNDFYKTEDLSDDLFQITYSAPWNKLIRTALVKKNQLRFSELQNSNDITFIYTALVLASTISWVKEPLIEYNYPNSGSIQAVKDRNPDNIVIALDKLYSNLVHFRKIEKVKNSFLRASLENIVFNLKTLRDTKAKVQLLEAWQKSSCYDLCLSQSRDDLRPQTLNLIEKIEDLRSTFVRNNKTNKQEVMNEKTTFTIIIPFFNDEKYILFSINSLKAQTFLDFKAIVVNDGSTDKSQEKIEEVISGDNRFVVIKQNNQGSSCARNAGILLANSDYVLFLDSDDALCPEALQCLDNAITKYNHPEIITFETKVLNLYSIDNEFGKIRTELLEKHYLRKGEYKGVLNGPDYMVEAVRMHEFRASVCLSLYKLSFLKENNIKFIPNITHEDNPFTFETLFRAKTIIHLNDKLYIRTVRPNSITTKKSSIKNVWGYFIGFTKTQALLSENLLNEEQAYAFQAVSFSLLEAARKQFKNLSDYSLFLSCLPKDKRLAFDKFIYLKENNDIRISQKELKLIQVKRFVFLKVRKFLKALKFG